MAPEQHQEETNHSLLIDVSAVAKWAAGKDLRNAVVAKDDAGEVICDAGLWARARVFESFPTPTVHHTDAVKARAQSIIASKKHPQTHRVSGVVWDDDYRHSGEGNCDIAVAPKQALDFMDFQSDAVIIGYPDLVYGDGILGAHVFGPGRGPLIGNYFSNHEILRTEFLTTRDIFEAALISSVCMFKRANLVYAKKAGSDWIFLAYPIRSLHIIRAKAITASAYAVLVQTQCPPRCNACEMCKQWPQFESRLKRFENKPPRERCPEARDLTPPLWDIRGRIKLAFEPTVECRKCKRQIKKSLLYAINTCLECLRSSQARYKIRHAKKLELAKAKYSRAGDVIRKQMETVR